MLTPRFECSQDDNYVIVRIKVPHMRESEMEYSICDNVFRFYVKPYFLRLTFQQSLKQDGSDYSKYDIQNGVFICYLPKKNKGEKFENLNMLTLLLSVPKKTQKKPMIEVVGSDSKDITEREELDVDFEQEIPPMMEKLKISSTVTYGFDSKYNDFFTGYHADHVVDILDLLKPETTEKTERTKLRVEQELSKFDAERYIQDYVLSEPILECIKFKPKYLTEKNIKWTEKEQQILTNLPKKEYLLSNPKIVYITLVDILCAYCYNHRTTGGENTVESAWTITKLSSSLSWFEEFGTLKACLIAFIRRCLIFPLYRHFQLALCCIEDVVKILRNGKETILRCYLDIKDLLDHSEMKYLLNKIYIDDYCVWIQTQSELVLTRLANEVEKVLKAIKKEDIPDFDLKKLESIAEELKKEGAFDELYEDQKKQRSQL